MTSVKKMVCITDYWVWKVSFWYWCILYNFLVKSCNKETDCTDEDEHSICDCKSGTCICKLGFSRPNPDGMCEETGMHHRILSLKSRFFQLIHFVSFPSKTMQQWCQLHYWGWKQYLWYQKWKVYLFIRFCHWSCWVVRYVSHNIVFEKSPLFCWSIFLS